jgi:hypothetical protein
MADVLLVLKGSVGNNSLIELIVRYVIQRSVQMRIFSSAKMCITYFMEAMQLCYNVTMFQILECTTVGYNYAITYNNLTF